MDSVAGSGGCAVKMPVVFRPVIPCSINLCPFVEELRSAKRSAKTRKRSSDVVHSPAAKVANDYGGAMNQWEATLIEIITITGNKNATKAQSFRDVIFVRMAATAGIVDG
jgi:hypothetical protein